MKGQIPKVEVEDDVEELPTPIFPQISVKLQVSSLAYYDGRTIADE